MPTPDFRRARFDLQKLDRTARYVGRTSYVKLYGLENILRVVVHTILSVQIGPDWWELAADPRIRAQASRFKIRYAAQPWHSEQGRHPIYYTFLSDLAEIMRANRAFLEPVLPEIDGWVARIEQVRLPRNVVGHMNYPDANDRKRIAVMYEDARRLSSHLAARGIVLEIPSGHDPVAADGSAAAL